MVQQCLKGTENMNTPFSSDEARLPNRGRLLVLVCMLCLLVLNFGVLFYAPTAHAEPAVKPDSGAFAQIGVVSYGWSAEIFGTNQYGTLLRKCINIPSVPPNGTLLAGWWWDGQTGVWVTFYHTGNGINGAAASNCNPNDPYKTGKGPIYFYGYNTYWVHDIGA